MDGPPDPIRIRPLAPILGAAPWRLTLPHDRPEALLIWITRGQGRVTINGVRRGMGAHNALFLPPGTLFALDPGPQCLGQVLICAPDQAGVLPDTPLHLRIRENRDQTELTALLEAIQREITAARPMYRAAVQAQVQLIGVWLARQAALGQQDAPKPDAAQRLVQRYAARIVTFHATDQTMGDHAAALDVTPTHLTRVCRKVSGQTAADMLILRRLHAARRLLAQGLEPAARVAKQLGFASPSYFTRFIQKHTGKTPSELREQAQKSLEW